MEDSHSKGYLKFDVGNIDKNHQGGGTWSSGTNGAQSPCSSPPTSPKIPFISKGGQKWAKIRKDLITTKDKTHHQHRTHSHNIETENMRPVSIPRSPVAGKRNPEQIYDYNNNSSLGNSNNVLNNNSINNNYLSVGDGKKKCMRLLVLGQDGVGKSAFVVRYLTRRFIGEYDPSIEDIFRKTVTLNNHEITVEIKDTAKGIDWTKRTNDLMWTHGLIFIYSITNQSSFTDIQNISRLLAQQKKSILILGNKKDLLRERRVEISEGKRLAAAINGTFSEISVRDDHADLERIVNKFIKDNCNELKNPALQLRMLSSRSSPEIRKGGSQTNIVETPSTESEVKTGKGRALWQKLRTNNDLKKKK